MFHAWCRAGVAAMVKGSSRFYWQRSMAWSWVGIAAAALLVNQSSVVSGKLCRKMSKHLSALCLGITRLSFKSTAMQAR